MSVQATTWVWEQRRWTGNTLLILLAIADAANREGGQSCQSAPTISAMVGCARSTVFRIIAGLERDGVLVRQGRHSKYGTTIWSLPIGAPAVEALDAPRRGSDYETEEGVSKSDPRPTSETGGVSPVRPNPKELTPSPVAHTPTEVAGSTRPEPYALTKRAAPETHPSRAIPSDWQPRPVYAQLLMRQYPGIDLRESCSRFVAFHIARGDTSRSWEATLMTWVSQDWERWKDRQGGTDDLGVPKGQRAGKQRAAQPGDPDYVDPDEIYEAARRVASPDESV